MADFRNSQCKAKNDKIFGDRMYEWEWHPSDLSKFYCLHQLFVATSALPLTTMSCDDDCEQSNDSETMFSFALSFTIPTPEYAERILGLF